LKKAEEMKKFAKKYKISKMKEMAREIFDEDKFYLKYMNCLKEMRREVDIKVAPDNATFFRNFDDVCKITIKIKFILALHILTFAVKNKNTAVSP
jgi:hypothetical protein